MNTLRFLTTGIALFAFASFGHATTNQQKLTVAQTMIFPGIARTLYIQNDAISPVSGSEQFKSCALTRRDGSEGRLAVTQGYALYTNQILISRSGEYAHGSESFTRVEFDFPNHLIQSLVCTFPFQVMDDADAIQESQKLSSAFFGFESTQAQ